MSAESRYNRFLQTADHVDMDRIWTEAEKDRRIYLRIIAPGTWPLRICPTPECPVGARFIKDFIYTGGNRRLRARRYAKHGYCTHLLSMLVERPDDGVEQLVGTIENNNAPMWAMLKKAGPPAGTATGRQLFSCHYSYPGDR